jgi:S1-C subfamily serine protease
MKRIKIYLLSILLVMMVVHVPVFSQNYRNNAPSISVSQDERENINVYKRASAAVVTIKSMFGSGAGCIIDPSGIVVTNKHVIGNNGRLTVSLSDGTSYSANILDVDNDDLALLKINANRNFPYIPLGDSSTIEVGQRVLAIGNPFGLERTLTTGIISRIDYNLNRIQTDAAINPGNSGGPLLNTKGELVGINQAILNPSGRSNSGIGFAIPANTVKRLLSLSRNARIVQSQNNNHSMVPRGQAQTFPTTAYKTPVFLGIAGKDLGDGKVLVSGVVPGSPAAKAGLSFRDIILAVDTVQVKAFNDIGFALKDKKPGDTVNLLYMRNGMVNNVSTVLVPRN